jgi:hypothetical protein
LQRGHAQRLALGPLTPIEETLAYIARSDELLAAFLELEATLLELQRQFGSTNDHAFVISLSSKRPETGRWVQSHSTLNRPLAAFSTSTLYSKARLS